MEDKDKYITLTDENGNKIELEILQLIANHGNVYVVFYPTDPNDTEVVILKAKEGNNPEECIYEAETDEKILQEVYEEFKKTHQGKDILFKD